MGGEAHSIGDHASMLPKNVIASQVNVFCCKSGSPPVHLPPERTASQGLSLNRSQYGGCSTKYNTPAGTQVVYRRFGGEQVVFPESSHKTNSSQSSSLTPAVCPGVHLAGRVDATPLAKRHVSTPLC
jgi:hypothetical protein